MMKREELLAHYARVRAHYRALAPAYSREANQTCEGRYRDIVQRVMRGRARVLELGSGSNDLLDRVGPPGSVACDLSIDMLQQRKAIARTAAVVGAGEQLPFRDGAFDLVCGAQMWHWTDPPAAEEVARVLRPGGRALLVVGDGVLDGRPENAPDGIAEAGSAIELAPVARASQARPLHDRRLAEIFADHPRREHLLLLQKT